MSYMRYTRKAWAVVAYSFQADIVCPACIRKIATRQADLLPSESVTTDDALSEWAAMLGIDPNDESSYDSGDFPKVIMSSDADGTECCGECHEPID